MLSRIRDFALYDANLPLAINGSLTGASPDYPTVISIGKSYFESYQTFPDTQYIHGFNLGHNDSAGFETLVGTVPLACNALKGGKLAYWELGNEPDLFKTTTKILSSDKVRPSNWAEPDYVSEWVGKTRVITDLVKQNCPDVPLGFIAPSFAGVSNSLDPVKTWASGLNVDKNILLSSSHKYVHYIIP